MKEKDRESQTSFLKTLEVYLLNNCKLKPAAEQLFIHQNTLNYRMKQIFDMTSIDLSHFSQRCELFIELMLMKKINNDDGIRRCTGSPADFHVTCENGIQRMHFVV